MEKPMEKKFFTLTTSAAVVDTIYGWKMQVAAHRAAKTPLGRGQQRVIEIPTEIPEMAIKKNCDGNGVW